mgnify:CR=1 FL=1
MKRTMLYAVLALLVFGSPRLASADTPVTLLVDGKRVPTTPAPVLRAGRMFIPVTLRKALADFDRALEADPDHELSLRASGYAWLALAYVENRQGGYTDHSKAQVRPYLVNSIDRFERLLRLTGDSPSLRYLMGTIRDQFD